ncbi:MAG: conjugal transfer protein TraX [Lachnospiraceae bacterium]|nr:conjugal transfer protein TraX [Lachnospiraceae bacterium]
MELKKPSLSGSTLKIIALIIMLIDHIGAVIVVRTMSTPGFDHDFWNSLYWPLRYIGRLAFPIFCFLLVEGFCHTSDVKKYFFRMVLFALISEIPFDLAVTGNWVDFWFQNVFWELSVGILAMMALEHIEKKEFTYVLQVVLRLTVIAVSALGAEVMQLDYGMYGIISIVALYVFRKNKLSQLLVGAISFCWEQVAPLAFLLIAFYNGKRGRKIKYAFYIFYPAHLLILYIIARVIGCQY